MSTKELPVFGGLLPSQMVALDTPLDGNVVGLRDGNPFIGGATVTDHLNKIFGYRWNSTITKQTLFPFEKQSNGNWAFACVCIVRLVIDLPGGGTITKDGTGGAEGSKKNKKQLYADVPKMAETFALRDAAMKLGEQFGMTVMRLKAVDSNGRAIGWKHHCQNGPPVLPNLVEASLHLDGLVGEGYRPQIAKLVEPDIEEGEGDGRDDAGHSDEAPDNRAAEKAAADRAAEKAAAGERAAEKLATEKAQAKAAASKVAAEAAAKAAAAKAASKPEDSDPFGGEDPAAAAAAAIEEKRKGYVQSCRDAFRALGKDRAMPIFKSVLERTGQSDMKPHQLPHAPDKGGATPETLVLLLKELNAAIGGK